MNGDRGVAMTRAKHLLALLEKNPKSSAKRLDDARELVNRVSNWPADAIGDAVYGLECNVLEVYGGIPEEDRQS